MNYLYSQVQDVARQLERENDALRKAFGKHLALVAEAMHDIEWVDSSDYCPGDEREAIEKVLGANAQVLELQAATEDAERHAKRLADLIEKSRPTST